MIYLRNSPPYQLIKPLRWSIIRLQRRWLDRRIDRALAKVEVQERRLLEQARLTYEEYYQHESEPLVSVVIPTYNRGKLLVERTIPSVLQQTYERYEIVVIGDCCTDDTPELVAKLNEPRIRFQNLPMRYPYPKDKKLRRFVAGVPAINTAMEIACGTWCSHLDDDDVYTPDHIEVLLRRAQEENLELVFGRSAIEPTPGNWVERGGPTFPSGYPPYRNPRVKTLVSHSAVLYRTYLRVIKYDVEAWRLHMGADMNRWYRIDRAGVRTGFAHHLVTYLPLRSGELVRAPNQPD